MADKNGDERFSTSSDDSSESVSSFEYSTSSGDSSESVSSFEYSTSSGDSSESVSSFEYSTSSGDSSESVSSFEFSSSGEDAMEPARAALGSGLPPANSAAAPIFGLTSMIGDFSTADSGASLVSRREHFLKRLQRQDAARLESPAVISKSLAQDPADAARLVRTREPHTGRLLGRAVRNYFPYFFTRDAVPMPLAGQYEGSSCFLIGNGPSFKEVESEPLRRQWTMTLNNGPTTFRGNANCTVDDPSRFNLSIWLDPTIQKFVPMGHFEKPLWDNRLLEVEGGLQQVWERSAYKVGDCPNVVGFRKNEKFHAARWLHEDTINWGNHKKFGGGRSVLLAALRILFLLGFRRVYLLGVDFEMSADRRYHFEEERTEGALRCNTSTYEKLNRWLGELKPHFLAEDFVVQNCNPGSHLKAFPYLSYKRALAEASAALGHYREERTSGMYAPLAEKEASSHVDTRSIWDASLPVRESFAATL